MKLICEQPEKILYTIRATMTAEEWRTVRDRLNASKPEHYDGYEPAGKFADLIDDLIQQANKLFYPSPTAPQREV